MISIKKVNIATSLTWTYGYDHAKQMTSSDPRTTDQGTLELRADYTYRV